MKIGIIGVGNMGRHHARVYAQMSNVQFIGVFDPNHENAIRMQDDYGCKVFADLNKLLNEVDAVSIAVPTSLHFKYAVACITKGVHVLIEKPITSLAEDAQKLIELARKKNVIIQVGHIERFNPAVQELQRILEGERVLAIEARRLSPFDGRITDVDVVIDLMIHDLDVVLSIVKCDMKSVNAVGACVKSEKNVDYCVASMLTELNQVVSLTASRSTEQKVRELAVTTENAYIIMDYMEKKITISRRTSLDFLMNVEKLRYRQENLIEKVYVPAIEPLVAQLTHFVDCIYKGQTPMVDGEAGLRALLLARNIQKQVYVEDCGIKVG